MGANLRRLASTGAAYGAGAIAQKIIAIALLPLFTRYVTRAEYGAAEVLIQLVFALTFFVRFGIIEALFRFYHVYDDPDYRVAVLRTVTWFLIPVSTVVSAAVALAAVPIAHAIVAGQANLVRVAAFGLWVVTLNDMFQSMFRLEGQGLAYMGAAISNIVLTAGVTTWLVVGRHEGATGLLLGNFLGTACVVVALAYYNRANLRRPSDARLLGPMLRFGVPNMSADVTLYAINVMDRVALVRFRGLAEAGLYALAMKFSQTSVFINQAFQLAWAPLAYSIRDDEDARRFYARAFTYFLLISTTVVLGTSLAAPWITRLLAAPAFYRAHEAVPIISLAVLIYTLYLTMIVAVGRVRRMGATVIAAVAGTSVNVVLLVTLVPPLGIIGAALALLGCCLVILPVLYAFVRRLFPIPFEWRRIVSILASGAVAYAIGALTSEYGATSLAVRIALVPLFLLSLWPIGFFHREELDQLLLTLRMRRRQMPPVSTTTPASSESSGL